MTFPHRISRAAAILDAAAAVAAVLAAGCYPDRWTSKYSELLGADVSELDSAVIEEAGHDAESKARIEAELKALLEEAEQEYCINAGDQIQVSVYNHSDFDVLSQVSPDGYIGMFFAGQIKVGGKTIPQAIEAVREGLSPYIKHPTVSITVKEVSSETATISGACAKPGLYGISSSTRLADIYAMAGGSAQRLYNGVVLDVADLEHSVIVRDGKSIPADFELAVKIGNPLHNIRLHKGDYIFIAQRLEASVTVCGEVAAPQCRPYEHGMELIGTLTAAGWMKETHWSHVIIIRNGLADPKMYKIDVDGILAGKCRNVKLLPNDIVYVPRDNMSEYNVFVRKLLPTAQIINLLTSRLSAISF